MEEKVIEEGYYKIRRKKGSHINKKINSDGSRSAIQFCDGTNDLNGPVELVHRFDDSMHMPSWMAEGFELENGEAQLTPWFKNVTVEEQKNDLMVPDPEAIYQYLCSLPGELKSKITEQEKAFRIYLERQISADKPFFIHKSTGIFCGYKK